MDYLHQVIKWGIIYKQLVVIAEIFCITLYIIPFIIRIHATWGKNLPWMYVNLKSFLTHFYQTFRKAYFQF